MAETEYKDVRVEETLRVKIGEAKNLPAASSSTSGGRNTCCAIKIDSEEIFRTSTVEKSRDPFYNAEFKGEIPKKFRHLSVYVYDVSNKNNKVLGKVSLKKEELYKFHQKDHWFPLTQQDGDTEVQGKVQVEVRLGEVLTPDNTTHRLAVSVCECSDLTVINGSCNPYAVVSLSYGKSRNKEVKRTAVKKKTICPQFDEKFYFYLDKGHNQDKTNYAFDDFMAGELSVSLFHDDSKVSREVLGNMFKGQFLGEVKIPVKDIDVSKPHKAWYCLQAKETHRSSQQPLGSLRLRISYSADYVFPSKYYNGLRELVLESAESKPVTSSAAFILGEIVGSREDAAKPLVKLFLHHGRLVPLIHALADWEMSNTIDPNTLFRGNSLLTKMVDELMKLTGIPYLRDTLKGFIDEVVIEAKPCEIDPSRVRDGEDITSNLSNLYGYVSECISNITNSGLVCPSVMRDVFSTLKARAMLNYPDNTAVRHNAVTSFIFLRFFTAAILSPTMFDLRSDILDSSVQRTLTLISKSISGIVNCVSSKSNTITAKEDYMVPLFDLLSKSLNTDVRLFLDIISSSSGCHFRGIEAPILLKEGFLIKRAQGRKKFGLKNFKKRFFRLTNQSLSYAKTKGEKYLFEIPINDILVVERLAESSFKMKYMFQVVHAQTALYIQASNCVEEKEWLDILMKICKSNKNRLKVYHPAAFVNGHWLCCKSLEQTAPGCTPVTSGLPLSDIQADIDSDREVEKIHSLFLTEIEKLDTLQAYVEDELGDKDACGSQAVYTGENPEPTPWQPDTAAGGLLPNPSTPLAPSPPQSPDAYQGSPVSNASTSFHQISGEGVVMLGSSIEDPGTCYTTLAEIQRCVITLEQEHIQYMRSVQRRTVIGSIDTPIGDESSADLVRNIYRSSERLSRHGSRSSNASNLSYRSYRGSRSRGGSFRERERSGAGGGGRRGRGQAEGVRKSLSGDVSSSSRNLGVEFKSEVKKAASYDVMSCDLGSTGTRGGGVTGSTDVMSCDLGNNGPHCGGGGVMSSTEDSLAEERDSKKPVFTVGRHETESYSGSSRTESNGGRPSVSVSSMGGVRDKARMRSSSAKTERGDSNPEQDDVFVADSCAATASTSKSTDITRTVALQRDSVVSPTQPTSSLPGIVDQQDRESEDLQQVAPDSSGLLVDKDSRCAEVLSFSSEDRQSQHNVSYFSREKNSQLTDFKPHEPSPKNVHKYDNSTDKKYVSHNSHNEDAQNICSSNSTKLDFYPSQTEQKRDDIQHINTLTHFNHHSTSQTTDSAIPTDAFHPFHPGSKSSQRDQNARSFSALAPNSNQQTSTNQSLSETASMLTESNCDRDEPIEDSTPLHTHPAPNKFHIFSRDPSQDDYLFLSNKVNLVNEASTVHHQSNEARVCLARDQMSAAAAATTQQDCVLIKQGEDTSSCVQPVNDGVNQQELPDKLKTNPYLKTQSYSKAPFSSVTPASQDGNKASACSLNGQPKGIESLPELTESLILCSSSSSSSSSSTSSLRSSPPPPPPQSPLVLLPQPYLSFGNQQIISISLPTSLSTTAQTPSLVLQPPTPHDPSEASHGEPISLVDPGAVEIKYV